MSYGKNNFVIISPCRNEDQYIRRTLNSVINQTFLPDLWIIVDDGSTDNTPQILEEYSNRYNFIQIITRKNRGYRSVGPGVIDSFYAGYNIIDIHSFEYLCKLDLDLDLPSQYFERLILRMNSNPRIGCCSGKPYYFNKSSGKLVSEFCSDENAIGASKFYRAACFIQIGGFMREVMWDGIDGHLCRLNGWIACSWDEPELRFIHLRPMGSSHKGIITGRMRHGYGQYFMGTDIIYISASTLYRMFRPPYVLGGAAILLGYLKSLMLRRNRLDDPVFRQFLHKFHWTCLIKGKKRATALFNRRQARFWNPPKKQASTLSNDKTILI